MTSRVADQSGGRAAYLAVAVNLGNATMCAVTVALIAAHRGWPF
jgi:hypothetical protein